MRILGAGALTVLIAMTLVGERSVRADEVPLPEMVVRPHVMGILAGRCTPDQPLFINDAIEFDVNQDGLVDIIYNATSCLAPKNTGSDQHGILLQKKDKSYGPATVPEIDRNLRALLVGTSNFEFALEDGQIVQNFSDTSERKHPLKLTLAWKSGSIVVARAQKAPLYPTSFDCAHLGKSSSASADFAVCSVKRLAAMDKLVGDAEKKRPGPATKKLARIYRDSRLTSCHLISGWVNCFEKSYLAELEALGLPMVLPLESKCGKGGMYFGLAVHPADKENLKFVLRYLHSGAVINDTPIEDQVADKVTPALVKQKLSDPFFEKWGGKDLIKNLQLLSISRYALESSAKDLPTGPELLSAPAVKSYLKAKADVMGPLQSRFGLFGIETGSDCN